ncbi:MAG: FAD-binding protein, partial [Lentisphaeria bacterium]|nr:FAD-binding protein [Lentisphaeria bacterium]
ATGSLYAFSGLQYIGLPLPQDRFGAVLRYQTDHDTVGRATSCGPRTSRLMVKVLCEEAVRLGVTFMNNCTGIQMLKSDDGSEVTGVIAAERSKDKNKFGLCILKCSRLILATGGPGEMYRDSVYPQHCFGSLGMAMEAGIDVANITESQFGIGTRRFEFPWNLSGTYVQVMPYVYSTDEEGNEYNFLADYYRTTQELVSNVFRKGYQWPFHATRMANYASSLVDLAIYIEGRKGHTVYMDFNRNPLPVPGDKEFSLERLDDDVRDYLLHNDAMQDLPIDRLRCMNPLSIELYKMHKKDITKEALPFDVNNQHMNGGIEIDIWARSSLKSCYAIGEIAGTHGVTRPGGAALNAGQVFATRCAKHIIHSAAQVPDSTISKTNQDQVSNSIDEIERYFLNEDALHVRDIRNDIQARMSDHAGFICHVSEIGQALKDAQDLSAQIKEKGIRIKHEIDAPRYYQWRQTALCSEAVLTALNYYAQNGGGSRGARAMCSSEGSVVPESRNADLEEFRYIEERDEDKKIRIILKFEDGKFSIRERPIRDMEDPNTIYFEKNWGNYLTDKIYKDGFISP